MQNMQRLRVMPRVGKSRTQLNNKFDGDMMSFTVVMTDDAIEEIDRLLNSKQFYISVDGRPSFGSSNDILDLVVKELAA